MDESTRKPRQGDEELLIADAKLRSLLVRKGDVIARQQGYPELEGMDAICRYLADKYHWLPSQARSLSTDDLRIVLEGV